MSNQLEEGLPNMTGPGPKDENEHIPDNHITFTANNRLCNCGGQKAQWLWQKTSGMLVLVSIGLLLWGVLYCMIGEPASPNGPLFRLGITFTMAHIAGWAVSWLHLPPLLGMLLTGIACRNLGFVNLQGGYLYLAATFRKMALVIILTRAGLGLDPTALKRLSGMVVRLAVLPSLTEATFAATMTHYLIGLPWLWGFLLGSVLAAVSPAVVIPCLFSLQARGYGVSKGIPTLVIASASFDDVLAISAFGVFLSIIFSTGSMTVQIIQGPIGLGIGLLSGIVWGVFMQHLPTLKSDSIVGFRTILLGGGGLLMILGSEEIGYEGAGPLGAITAAFVACHAWRRQGWTDDKNPVASNFAIIWKVFQPILFGLIGTEINLFVLEAKTVSLGLLCLLVSLSARILISVLAAAGGGLDWKEKVFVSFAWFPKATVQAAIGPVALDLAREQRPDQDDITYASKVLMLAVLAILITAPIGSSLISLLGPKLLKKEETRSTSYDNAAFH